MTAFVLNGDVGPQDPGVRLYFGIPGSGKSYRLRHDAIAASQSMVVIVVDATREWVRDDGTLVKPIVTPEMKGARTVPRVLDLLDTMKRGIIVFHPRVWIEDTTTLVSSLTVRGAQDTPIGIAMSEGHNLMPNGPPLQPGYDAIVTRWRHLRMAAWIDTQRPARLARTVTELATVIHVFATNGPRDLDATAELVSDPKAFQDAAAEATRRYAQGEQGWHVRLGINRSPPYTLERV